MADQDGGPFERFILSDIPNHFSDRNLSSKQWFGHFSARSFFQQSSIDVVS